MTLLEWGAGKRALPRDPSARPPPSTRKVKRESTFRPRASKPRVRTGCIVCKIRRVKCDEAKPACVRCTSTGRKCDGYAEPASKMQRESEKSESPDLDVSSSNSTVSRRSTRSPEICYSPSYTPGEESIQFFWSTTQTSRAWQFGDDFWGDLALPAAHIYPAVQHSLHAISTLYVAYLRKEHAAHPSQGVLDTPTSRVAVLRYNAAVKLVSDDLAQGKLPPQVVLICCLLFVWLEFLRNDFVAGLRHLKSGLLILRDEQQNIDGDIVHMFTRLQAQATIHGCPASDFNSVQLACPSEVITRHIPESFQTGAEARHYLDSKLVSIFQLIRQKQNFEARQGPTASLSPEWPQFIRSRDSHLADLKCWHTAFRNSPGLGSTSAYETDSARVLLLAISYEMGVMVMTNLFSESEMDYDQYDSNFERLVSLAERVLGYCDDGQSPQTKARTPLPMFSLDVGVIQSLFYVTLKCRNAGIRQRAILALKSAPEREGMWHRDSMVAAAAWKMGMEDWWRGSSGDGPGVVDNQIPTSARIYREKVVDADFERIPAKVRFDGGPGAVIGNVECEIHGLLSRLGDMI